MKLKEIVVESSWHCRYPRGWAELQSANLLCFVRASRRRDDLPPSRSHLPGSPRQNAGPGISSLEEGAGRRPLQRRQRHGAAVAPELRAYREEPQQVCLPDLSLPVYLPAICRSVRWVKSIVFGGSKSARFVRRKNETRLYDAYVHIKAKEMNKGAPVP